MDQYGGFGFCRCSFVLFSVAAALRNCYEWITKTLSKYFKMAGIFCYRSLHTVRPHIPLIHFPKRFPLGSLTYPGKSNAIAPETKIPNIIESSRNNGAIDDSELPIRYRRTVILPEEIIYIERGGPD